MITPGPPAVSYSFRPRDFLSLGRGLSDQYVFNMEITRISFNFPRTIKRDGRWLMLDTTIIRMGELQLALNKLGELELRASTFAADDIDTVMTIRLSDCEIAELLRLWVLPEDFEVSFA